MVGVCYAQKNRFGYLFFSKIAANNSMRLLIVPLFIILEIYTFVQVSNWLGFLWALLGIFLGFVLGINYLRFIGGHSVRQTMMSIAQGQAAPGQMGSIIFGMVAAILFMAPGFVSDLIAVLLILPPGRYLLGLLLKKRLFTAGTAQFNFRQSPFHQNAPFQDDRFNQGNTFEGEATPVEPDAPKIEKDK